MEDVPATGTTSISPPHGLDHPKKRSRKALRGFTLLMLGFLGFAIFFVLNFKTVVVSGESMYPTFNNGERVLVSQAYWLVGDIKRKDVVVLKDTGPTGYMIKRVYRMAGESVDWVNAPEKHPLSAGEYVVPDGMIYVLGDNRSHSEDSRKFGAVPRSDILGKVVVRP